MRNDAPSVLPDNIPPLLRGLPQWVCWKMETRAGKQTKVPYNAMTGERAKSNDYETWAHFDQAYRTYLTGGYSGIGFVLHENNGIVGVDLDNCLNTETGEISDEAQFYLMLMDTYSEVTPSGRGLRFFALGDLPPGGRKKGDFEVYNSGRFLTVTGNHWPETPLELMERQEEIAELHQSVWPPEEHNGHANGDSNGHANGNLNNGHTPLPDQELMGKMFNARNNGLTVRQLQAGNWQGAGYNSQSEADMAFCCHLAFYTGRDETRMDQMFRASGLMRPKWDEKHFGTGQTYGQGTIARAVMKTRTVYNPQHTANGQNGTVPTNQDDDDEPEPEPDGGQHEAESDGAAASAKIKSKRKKPGEPGAAKGKSQATMLVEIGLSYELFHAPDGEAYAARGQETFRLRSMEFRDALAKQHFQETHSAASSQAAEDALRVLCATARQDGPEFPTYNRVAIFNDGTGDKIYFDLCDRQRHVIEVSETGWRVAGDNEALPVKFIRPKGMEALPLPVDGGTIDDLRHFINVRPDSETESDFTLVKHWMAACLYPRLTYPVLQVGGGQGSAKSTTCAVFKYALDPGKAASRSAPRESRDLAIAANNCHLVNFDNLSAIADWLSDDLCRLSTGAGFATRKLHTDDEEMIFYAKRPILLNGIGDVGTRSDLLSRSILLKLPIIEEDKRRPEAEFWRELEVARPKILGALLNMAAGGLRMMPTTKLKTLPRMADFALWATACERSEADARQGRFMEIYAGNREDASNVALENTPVAAALCDWLQKQPPDLNGLIEWEGRTGELFAKLLDFAGIADNKIPKAWPVRANELGRLLERIAPDLAAFGVTVRKLKHTNKGSCWFVGTPMGNTQESQNP